MLVKYLARPEFHQTAHTSHLEFTINICSVQRAYLDNHKEIFHKPNFPSTTTHQRITEAWNHQKSFTGQEIKDLQTEGEAHLDAISVFRSEFRPNQGAALIKFNYELQ